MDTVIWMIQGLLAAFFIMPAFTKLTSSPEKLIEKKMLEPAASHLPVRGIGLLELLGVFGCSQVFGQCQLVVRYIDRCYM
jgi:hypothetical protein